VLILLLAPAAKANAEDLVKAFREAAKELGCNRSEQRFQEALFAIGRYKPVKEPIKALKVIPESRASAVIATSLKLGRLTSVVGQKRTCRS
jgi:hypothetical protein